MVRSAAPNLADLKNFSHLGERSATPFFVGRNSENRLIERACQSALVAAQAGQQHAGAVLIQGAPGAGKTSLLYRAMESWTARGPAPLALVVPRDVLASEERITRLIVQRIDAGKEVTLRSTVTQERDGSVKVAGSGVRIKRSAATAPPPSTLEWLANALPARSWARPLALMIDEVQNLRSEQAAMLMRLHEGSDRLPIQLVMAGLGNSKDILVHHGISRLDNTQVISLGRLKPGEPQQAVKRMLARYRIKGSKQAEDDWAHRIEEASDRWPQHLHTSMVALARGLIATGGSLLEVDAEDVIGVASDLRRQAYFARLSPEMDLSRYLVSSLMDACKAPMMTGDVIGLIESLVRAHLGWRVPHDLSANGFLEHLIHKGVFQKDSRVWIFCPIPSFRQFLIAYGAR